MAIAPPCYFAAMRLSQRSAVHDEPTALSLALAQARCSGRPLVDLTQSNPTRVDLSYQAYARVADWAAASSPELWSRYSPASLGLASAREAIARAWPSAHAAEPADPERLLLVTSSSEAYSYLFTVLCDAEDEVLVPRPSYPLLSHLGQYASVRLVPYSLAYDGVWHIDFDSLRRALGPKSRAIVLVNPNNPTGSYVKRSELAALAALGLPLIVDEVFSRFEHGDDRALVTSVLGASEAPTFCIDGLSKSAGLPQLKLSWIAASGPPARMIEAWRRLEWLADTYLSASTPVQRALPALLDAARDFRSGLCERLRQNHAALVAALEGSAASVLRLEGGWYGVVQVPRVLGEDEWTLGLLEREGVLVHPGYFYDFERPAYLVVSLLPAPAEFARGAAALRREVERNS
jgi:aspartate/methionine/tyrosine aminotransferase